MNKPPKEFDQETIIQHAFRYAEVKECFQSFRLVCKAWKHAVENMRFNRCLHSYRIRKWESKIKRQGISAICGKYLHAFRKLSYYLCRQDPESRVLIVNNMKKLNEIEFE